MNFFVPSNVHLTAGSHRRRFWPQRLYDLWWPPGNAGHCQEGIKKLTISFNALALTISENFLLNFWCQQYIIGAEIKEQEIFQLPFTYREGFTYKVHIYPEYRSVCSLVLIGTPHFRKNVPARSQRGGGHTRLRVRGWGSPNWDDWRKSLPLCLLCGFTYVTPVSILPSLLNLVNIELQHTYMAVNTVFRCTSIISSFTNKRAVLEEDIPNENVAH
jgi:hypothetical protein